MVSGHRIPSNIMSQQQLLSDVQCWMLLIHVAPFCLYNGNVDIFNITF